MITNQIRYGVINDHKEKMEVVLLVGGGCTWGKCTFCDFKNDYSPNINERYKLNKEVLSNVTGEYNKLQVICSGSFAELDLFTLQELRRIVTVRHIKTIIFEGHWNHRHLIPMMYKLFNGIAIEFIIGVESFDTYYREHSLNKGIGDISPANIGYCFDRANILVGLEGQTLDYIVQQIKTGLKFFDYVCVNVFTPNTTDMNRDEDLMIQFYNSNYFKQFIKNPRIRILDDWHTDITDTFANVGTKLDNFGGIK